MRSTFSRENLPRITLVVVLLACIYSLWYFHPWKLNRDGTRGVIKWDVISYYGFLPATVIYGDVTLDFVGTGVVKNDNKFWYVKLENGNRLIVTSMGLSFLYAPFFFIAHLLAPITGQTPDGFSNIYQLMLLVSGLFYSMMGLILLMRMLRKRFDPLIVSMVLLAVALGTNLFYYSTNEAAMPHSHNFFLITLFVYLVIRWYERPVWNRAVWVGGVFGLIALVRPTNILLFIFLFLYGVTSWKSLGERVVFYLRNWYLVAIMLAAFLVPWIPQFLYWKEITGQYIFFTYAEKNAGFFWGQPHILKSLFHFRKGWLIYVPIMSFALVGIFFLRKWARDWFLALAIYVPAMIYVQSSWWCWWFGGGYGLRPYISMYPLLAFPMAYLFNHVQQEKKRRSFVILASAVLILTAYQLFQTRQFTTQAIHYSATTFRSYMQNFLKARPTPKSWKMLEVPDFNLARHGIHVSYPTDVDKEVLRAKEKAELQADIREEIAGDKKLQRQIQRYSERDGITPDSAMNRVVERMYERKIR